ncbi:unnamed protein product, partial [Nesidiocoris tenuis]
MKLDERTCARVVDSRNRSAYGLLSRAGRLVRTSAMLVRPASNNITSQTRSKILSLIEGLGCPARHRPVQVPAAGRVSMAGESGLDQCSNGIAFSCVKLSFKA